uniref:MHC class I-like antigen recognition-like domain-containing protein n=1 Tax=Gouania willdenowi TaxID=441366 RepID=A0A8C5GUA2_GOUWI
SRVVDPSAHKKVTFLLLHTLRYFSTASSDVPNFPEFVFVGYVDDVQIIHYDSNSRTAYWEEQTGKLMGSQKRFKDNIETLKQRFNQTGDVWTHTEMCSHPSV